MLAHNTSGAHKRPNASSSPHDLAEHVHGAAVTTFYVVYVVIKGKEEFVYWYEVRISHARTLWNWMASASHPAEFDK
jgi:sarcosine oxidase gamma subunit